MDIIGNAFIHSLLVQESRRLSYNNYMFIDNVCSLFYPTEKGERETRAGMNLNLQEVLTDNTRTEMFEEALKFDKDGNKSEALKCYLKCLVGLKENTRFSLLPQCLRNVSKVFVYL